jgi:hypothetical protein
LPRRCEIQMPLVRDPRRDMGSTPGIYDRNLQLVNRDGAAKMLRRALRPAIF